MIELNKKHVLHIPLHKFEDKSLKKIYISQPLDELDKMLQEEGYTSFYKSMVNGFYKGRSFDELLITVFSSDDDKTSPSQIFIKWFRKNNHLLKQESFAYEEDNKLIIYEL